MTTRRSMLRLLPAFAIAAMLPRGLSRPVEAAEATFPSSVTPEPMTSNTAQTIEFNAVRNAVFNEAFNRGYASGMAENGFMAASEPARLWAEEFVASLHRGSSDVRVASEGLSAAFEGAIGRIGAT